MNQPDLSSLYWAVGAMVVLNLGTIVTIIGAVVRGIWFMAKLDARVHANEKDVNNAHKAIRKLQNGDC